MCSANMAENAHLWQLVRNEQATSRTPAAGGGQPSALNKGTRLVEEIHGPWRDNVSRRNSAYLPIVEDHDRGHVRWFDFPHLDKHFRLAACPSAGLYHHPRGTCAPSRRTWRSARQRHGCARPTPLDTYASPEQPPLPLPRGPPHGRESDERRGCLAPAAGPGQDSSSSSIIARHHLLQGPGEPVPPGEPRFRRRRGTTKEQLEGRSALRCLSTRTGGSLLAVTLKSWPPGPSHVVEPMRTADGERWLQTDKVQPPRCRGNLRRHHWLRCQRAQRQAAERDAIAVILGWSTPIPACRI